jgi:hypothetical protein
MVAFNVLMGNVRNATWDIFYKKIGVIIPSLTNVHHYHRFAIHPACSVILITFYFVFVVKRVLSFTYMNATRYVLKRQMIPEQNVLPQQGISMRISGRN